VIFDKEAIHLLAFLLTFLFAIFFFQPQCFICFVFFWKYAFTFVYRLLSV